MAERSEKSATEKKYLLGVLPAEESSRLEDRYFADDQLFEEIELEEDELIDGYIRKSLDKNDRKVFEQAMRRSKRLNERVAFARVLLTKTSKPAPLPTPSWWASIKAFFSGPAVLKSALAMALLLVVVGAVFFTAERGRLRQESQQLAQQRSSLEEQQQQLRRQIDEAQLETQRLTTDLQNQKQTVDNLKQQLEITEQQLAQIRPQTRGGFTASIALFPAGVRAGGGGADDIDILTVQPDQKQIRLTLNLDNDEYTTYGVSIESGDKTGPNFPSVRAHGPPSQRLISIQFKTNQLNAGDYIVKVSGRTPSGDYEPVTSYRFRLVKK